MSAKRSNTAKMQHTGDGSDILQGAREHISNDGLSTPSDLTCGEKPSLASDFLQNKTPSNVSDDRLNESSHKVTITVTLAMAIPINQEAGATGERGTDSRRRRNALVEVPRAQNFYHLRYFVLPDDDDPVKTDVVTYGKAAKIYSERQEAKVLKTWIDGDKAWVTWTHCHPIDITKDVLLNMFKHNLQVCVWDTRDKVSTRAKFDRTKAFRLPNVKSGEDPENVGGVKSLVMEQSRAYEKMQPKRPSFTRPLPSHTKPAALKHILGETGKSKSDLGTSSKATSSPIDVKAPTQDGQPVTSYPNLVGLAAKGKKRGSSSAGPYRNSKDPLQRLHLSTKPSLPNVNLKSNHMNTLKHIDSESTIAHLKNTKPRRGKKAESESLAAAEHSKKYGVACVSIRMATLFAGLRTITTRLDKPIPTLDDMFLTVSLSDTLFSLEQKKALNPLIIKVHSATAMPNTPICYADLSLRCRPAYIKYKLFNKENCSIGKMQDDAIYWDDINVVLAGVIDRSELFEYLNGPPLEIEVHDRDHLCEKRKVMPTLFGDDLEDQKISNVGTITSKSTMHNPFSTTDQQWDPHGQATFDLSGLLLGQTILHLKSPIHSCAMPDLLGMRDERIEGNMMGVPGSGDRTETAITMGHYLESNSMLKIRVEIAHPLSTPAQLAGKPELASTEKCPFNRIIFKFDYQNFQLLQRLQDEVTSINGKALELDMLPDSMRKTALSTYKLTPEQQQSGTLDIITGFQIMDGTMHLFVLEGLRDAGVTHLWKTLPMQEDSDMQVIFNSDMSFEARLYGTLDVDLSRIKLHEPLNVIMEQPLLYVRDMVPQPCFLALVKLHQMRTTKTMQDVLRYDRFPDAEMVISVSREFGVPITKKDFKAIQPVEAIDSKATFDKLQTSTKTSRTWTPIDNMNTDWITYTTDKLQNKPKYNFIKDNKEEVHAKSAKNHEERIKNLGETVRADVAVAHNYSTQTLNSTQQAKEKLRTMLMKQADPKFTYDPDNDCTINMEPEKPVKETSDQWQLHKNWTYPGKKTMLESNTHSHKPHYSRIEELQEEWVENSLYSNIQKPTLQRDHLHGVQRHNDFDIWRKPYPRFGSKEQFSIMLTGTELYNERLAALHAEQMAWKNKVIVDERQMHFHRVGTQTELHDNGCGSNKLDRLRGMLKDRPIKLALASQKSGLQCIPPLDVVNNPSVDTVAREAGIAIMPDLTEKKISGFMPGPYDNHSWMFEHNKIPTHNYQHHKFIELKGQDFKTRHIPQNFIHKRTIKPLSFKEQSMHMFRWPENIPKPQTFVVAPNIDDMTSYPEQILPKTEPNAAAQIC